MDIMAAIIDFMAPLPVWDARGDVLLPLFGAGHVVWLCICIALCTMLAAVHRRLSPHPERRRTLERAMVWTPIALYAAHTISMLAFGVFNANCLPLHLCNLAEVLAVVFAYTASGFWGATLYGVGMVGSLAALLFPGWATAPAFSLPAVCGFVEHSFVLAFIIVKLRDKSISPALAHVWRPLVFTGIYAAAIYPFNKLAGTNFAFVNWAPYGTPLLDWEQRFGNPGYIAIYLLVFVLLELALFLPWRAEATPAQQR